MAFLLTDSVIYANARFRANSSDEHIANSLTPIRYENIDYDSANSYNPLTGEYTIPVSGTWRITGKFRLDISSVNSSTTTAAIYINGISTSLVFVVTRTDSNATSIMHTDTLFLNKGDVVTFRPGYNGPSVPTEGGSSYNSFAVERLSDFSAGQAIGFGLATSTKHGLVGSANIENVHISPTAAIEGSKIQEAGTSNAGVISTGSQSISGSKTFNDKIINPAGISTYVGTSSVSTATPVTLFTLPFSSNTSWLVNLNFASGTGSTRCGIALVSTRNDGSVTVCFNLINGGLNIENSGNSIRASVVSSGTTSFHYNAIRLR